MRPTSLPLPAPSRWQHPPQTGRLRHAAERRRNTLALLALATALPATAQERWTAEHLAPPPGLDVRLCWHDADARVVAVSARGGAATLETWEWDGTGWHQRRPAAAPQVRQSYAMTYDAVRRVVVLFGGHEPLGQFLGDTWEWDGFAWTVRATSTAPSPRGSMAMAYDARRQRVVLYGGSQGTLFHDDLWEWDGTRWTQQPQTAPWPGRRAGAPMTFDAARGRLVLFGGSDGGFPRDDVWEHDGSQWRSPAPALRPPGLRGPTMAFDPLAARCVLYGGDVLGAPNTDTWEWDGGQWQRLPTAVSPGHCLGAGMAYDERRQRLVLHGGKYDTETWVRDRVAATWTRVGPVVPSPIAHATIANDGWGGTLYVGRFETLRFDHATLHWQPQPSPSRPAPSLYAAMAFDSARREVVLFGAPAGGAPETWIWSDATRVWQRRTPPAEPPPVQFAGMAFDASRGRTVLFGGMVGVTAIADTWEWDGTNWTAHTPAAAPVARIRPAMAFDPASGRVVLFGGSSATQVFGDVWEWDGATWLQRAMSNPGPGPRVEVGTGSRSDGVLIVGGHGPGGASFADVWLLRGTQWQPLSTSSSVLPVLFSAQVAYDPHIDELVAFGGHTIAGTQALSTGGIWVYGIPRATEIPYGAGCAGSGGWPEIAGGGLPWLGNTAYALQARRLAASQPAVFVLGGATAPLELLHGCRVFVTPVVAAPVTVSASGVATLQAPVPALPRLAGVELHVQAAALDPTGPGLVVTPALMLRLGR